MTQVPVTSLDESLARKLTALRKIADSSQNEAEGTAALLAIQRLMAANDLEESNILFDEVKEVVDVVEAGETMVAVPQWKTHLHIVIAKNFRCGSIITNYPSRLHYGRTQVQFKFVGKGKDPIFAKEAFETACSVIDSLWDIRREKVREMLGSLMKFTGRDRKDYALGFVEGLRAAYKNQVAKAELGIILVRPQEVTNALSEMKKVECQIDQSAGLFGNIGFRDGDNYARGNVLSNVGGI